MLFGKTYCIDGKELTDYDVKRYLLQLYRALAWQDTPTRHQEKMFEKIISEVEV